MPRLTLTKPEIEAIVCFLESETDVSKINHPFQYIIGRHAKNSLLMKLQLLLATKDTKVDEVSHDTE